MCPCTSSARLIGARSILMKVEIGCVTLRKFYHQWPPADLLIIAWFFDLLSNLLANSNQGD